jgi:hypothetical protein
MKSQELLKSRSWLFVTGVIIALLIAIAAGLRYFGKL